MLQNAIRLGLAAISNLIRGDYPPDGLGLPPEGLVLPPDGLVAPLDGLLLSLPDELPPDELLDELPTVRPDASTVFTPFTPLARRTAWFFSDFEVAVPVNVTAPSEVFTVISDALMPLAAANLDFTLVVIQVSSTLPGTVSLLELLLEVD